MNEKQAESITRRRRFACDLIELIHSKCMDMHVEEIIMVLSDEVKSLSNQVLNDQLKDKEDED